MAERVMSGAVTSLLAVIEGEARLLGGVRDDVQFIKEEMESMNSFLLHLARTVPPGGKSDEHAMVRTWMNQVRLLARDCKKCIDIYLHYGNSDALLAKDVLRRYLLWAPWFLRKMVEQHRAAVKLAALKDRARAVAERRSRYGVEVPAKEKAVTGPLSSTAPSPSDDEEDDDNQEVTTATHHSGQRGALFGLRNVGVNYFNGKLADWIKDANTRTGSIMPSIAIVAPDAKGARALADEALAVAETHFQRSVLVDIPAVHFSPSIDFVMHLRAPEPEDILCYIWRELELKLQLAKSESQQEAEGEKQHFYWRSKSREGIQKERTAAIGAIWINAQEMKVYEKLEKIEREVWQMKLHQLQLKEVRGKISEQPLGVLLLLLQRYSAAGAAAAEQDQVSKEEDMRLAAWYDDIIENTANKLKEHMEVEEEAAASSIRLDNARAQYEDILREVFPKTSNRSAANEATMTTSATTLVEDQIKLMIRRAKQEILETTTSAKDQIKEMISRAKQEILQQLEEDKSDKKQATGKLGGLVQIPEPVIEETTEKIETIQDQIPKAAIEFEDTIQRIQKIQEKIKKLMEYKGIVDKIQNHLRDARTLIILKTSEDYVLRWEETRNALSLLGCVGGAVIVTASNNTQQAKEYCNPLREPLDSSLVGFYHDIVLELTGHQMHEDNSQIIRGILNKCKPHEFCMKILAHALYANPKMSKQELCKLHSTLQETSPKSLGSIAMKMLKFSYNNLRKEYKSCLLYLAIFPQGHKIRRSTLIGRWVAEGLITTEDLRWSSSVCQADRCFDALIDRWLVYPGDIGATGKIKSCIVGHLVHEFITKIAKKQHIVETSLSHHLARHFSIFNDLHLRASDTIHTFFQNIPVDLSELSQLKVLDLEGCGCLLKQRYLKDICNKILLLKYLSLRGTNVTHLPSEINNLSDLEVLDIRETMLPPSATRNVVLLKLKRLLAGQIGLSPSMAIGPEESSSVLIPEKIKKMVNMEVLSNVKPWNNQDLKDIRKLWQLRKLGVVIDDKNNHFWNLFRTISDLHECLQSLSITLPTTILEGTPPIKKFPDNMRTRLKCSPKLLENLSISGTTERVALLKLLVKDGGGNQLKKVTLTRTRLNQNDLQVLAELPMLRCVRLQDIICTEGNLTFKEEGFPILKYLVVEGSNDLTEITFEIKAAPELEKIVLSMTGYLKSLPGVESLPKLEELELKKNSSRLFSFFDKAKQIAKVTLRNTFMCEGDLQILAKNPNMHCLELLDKSYNESKLTFKESDFPKLNILVVDCSTITNISFADESTPMLKKITWSFTNMESLSGIDKLLRLKELELIGDGIPNEVEEEIKKHKDIYYFKHRKPGNQDQAAGNEEDDDARFPLLCWKRNKV